MGLATGVLAELVQTLDSTRFFWRIEGQRVSINRRAMQCRDGPVKRELGRRFVVLGGYGPVAWKAVINVSGSVGVARVSVNLCRRLEVDGTMRSKDGVYVPGW